MYEVIVKQQKPNYKWERATIGRFITKDEADVAHIKQSKIAQKLIDIGHIIDYQIETLETY